MSVCFAVYVYLCMAVADCCSMPLLLLRPHGERGVAASVAVCVNLAKKVVSGRRTQQGEEEEDQRMREAVEPGVGGIDSTHTHTLRRLVVVVVVGRFRLMLDVVVVDGGGEGEGDEARARLVTEEEIQIRSLSLYVT